MQNNLPNADAGNTGAGSQEARQEETTNYEISKTVRTLIHEQPQIDRISLAVMVDDTDTAGADGKHVRQPRPAEELDHIATLVKSAIGFDDKRGDQVDVVSMHFAADDVALGAGQPGLLGIPAGKVRPDAPRADRDVRTGRIAGFALRAASDGDAADHVRAGQRVSSLSPPGGGTQARFRARRRGPAGRQPRRPRAGAPACPATPLLEDESMVNLAQIEGQIRASSLRRVTDLVDKHPDETLAIVRGWMVQENG